MKIKDYIEETRNLELRLGETFDAIEYLKIFDAVENRILDMEILLKNGYSLDDEMPEFPNRLIEIKW